MHKKDRRLEKGLQKALSDKCKSWQHGQMLAGRGQKMTLHVTAAQNKEESSIFGAWNIMATEKQKQQ